MNRDFLLKYVFTSFLLITLLSVAFLYDKEQQEQKLENTLFALIKQIGLLDLKLNQTVLEIGFDMDQPNKVQIIAKEFNSSYQDLNGKISTVEPLYSCLMRSQLESLYWQMYQKRQAVEKFQAQTIKFNQQLKQLQELSHQILAQNKIDSNTKNKIIQIEYFAAQQLFSFSKQTTPVAINELKLLNLKKPYQAKKIAAFMAQATILVKEKQNLSLAFNFIIKIKTQSLLETIERNIKDYFDNQQQKKAYLQYSLFFIVLLSVVYIVYLVIYLRHKAVVLDKLLAESEKQQIALNEHAIVSAADIKGNITYVNKKFCEISGYSAEELLGQNHRILKSGYHSHEVYTDMWRTLSEGKVWHGELKNKKKDGGFYWVNGTIVPFLNKQGKSTQYISIRTDITRQKELEKQLLDGQHFLKQVTGAMAQGLYALNEKGLCTFWNKEAEHILGWTEQELLNKEIHKIIHFQDENGVEIKKENCLIYKTIENNKTFSSETEFFTHKDGRVLPISVIAVPLLEKNKTIGLVAVFSDITKRKADEKIIKQAIINAQQASQAKSDFLANMSHEIRTPMNGIIGMTELTLETSLSSEQREFLEIVKDSSYALLAIVNDVLDFSKIEAGKLILEHIDFNLTDLLYKTLAILTPKAEQKNLTLSIVNQITSISNLELIGDPGRLRQIILNLVGNAIKFTLQGSIKVRVSLVEKRGHKCCVLFSVTDTGIGIPKEKQNDIFEAFSQADTSVTRRFGGTGLGLSISKQFVELMGGDIWLESQPNSGTTFFFTCWFEYKNSQFSYLVKQETTENQQILPTSTEMTETESDYSTVSDPPTKLTILLAEDNLINQKLAKKLLEKQGYCVQIANNGIEAVALFQQQPFDLILMDFQMPEMNGLEAAAKIRELELPKGDRVPIIAMTANAMKEDKERAIAAGMDAYVPKPIDVQELLTQIEIFFPLLRTIDDTNRICNWDGALSRLGGETEIMQMLVNLFLEEQSNYLNNIKQALAEKNAVLLQRELHTLRGVCATIGAEKIEQDIRIPETLVAQEDFDACAITLAKIEQDLIDLSAALRKKMKLD